MSSRMIESPQELIQLPDGSVIQSSEGCGWPERYAGVRWVKNGGSMRAMGPDRFGRFTRGSSLIKFFKDPLPAEVVE